MNGNRFVFAIVGVVTLIASSCGASETSTEPEVVAEATESTALTTAVESEQEQPTTTALDPEPPATFAAAEPDGPFACSNQEPGEVIDDPQLSADLEALVMDGVPGLAAATVSSDGLLRIGAAGSRVVDGEDQLLTTDRMHLGSDTKAMTATLLALLTEDFDLEVTTPITDIWPNADAGWAGVTLLDLLHHRGGAENNLGRDQAELWRQMWQASIDAQSGSPAERAIAAQAERSRFAESLTSAPPNEDVGQFAYSNSGYILVGAAIESRLGEPWEDLMCEYLFKPLRMDGCGFGAPPAPGPQGHGGDADALTPASPDDPASDNPAALGPAGTVYCPLADWGRYLSWVLRGAQGTDDLLPPATWDMLLEPDGEYASGWGVTERPWAQGPIYTHAGSNTMWFAVAWVAPELDRAFLIASNAATPQAQRATDQGIGLLIESDGES